MSDTFFFEADSGDNKAIGRECTFFSSDTQVQVYTAVSSGAYNIVGCRYTSERRYLNRFIRYVSIVSFISSYSFILLAFVDYLLNPRFGFFFYFLFHGCLLFFIGVYIGSKQT